MAKDQLLDVAIIAECFKRKALTTVHLL